MDQKFAYKSIIIIVVCIAGRVNGFAQNQEQAVHPSVVYVSQFPEHKDEGKKNAFRRIYDFLLKKNTRFNMLNRPVAVLAEDPADLLIVDQGAETVFRLRNNKLDVPKSIRKKENFFTSLVCAASLPDGDFLFTDSRLNKVYRIRKGEKKVAGLNDTLLFQQPTGIAYSVPSGQVWVVETGAHRVAILDTNGKIVKYIGARGSDNGEFNYPTSISIDSAGDAYIVDAMNFRVQIFNKNGEFVTAFGEEGDGPGTFSRPKGIATDTYGNIYVADALFHNVQIFDRAGEFLYSFGKQGREKEEFWMPAGIYIDNNNYIYVADSYNSRIQVFQLINGS